MARFPFSGALARMELLGSHSGESRFVIRPKRDCPPTWGFLLEPLLPTAAIIVAFKIIQSIGDTLTCSFFCDTLSA